ncbi:hypothetical protein F4859DRAFT_500602 [Xylaria cf. heliscus]|nr:hypothetical protein F4859DRAFT_500602 [Xylaria cf. heliscus]
MGTGIRSGGRIEIAWMVLLLLGFAYLGDRIGKTSYASFQQQHCDWYLYPGACWRAGLDSASRGIEVVMLRCVL